MPKATKASKSVQSTKAAKVAKATPVAEVPKPSKGKGKAVERKLYSSFLPVQLAIPSALPSTSSSSASSSSHSTHTIFVRPDKTKTTGEDDGRKLFVANLPVDTTERDLRVVFGRWGVIEDIEFTGGGDTDALEKAVIADMADEDLSSDEDEDEAEEAEAPEEEEEATRAEPTFTGDGQPKLSRKNRPRRKVALPVSVPDIVPLPPTNPRSTPYAPAGTRCAHITYLDALPVTRAMGHTGVITLDKYNASEPSGLQYYLKLYSSLRPDLASVKAFADSSMARFDHLQSMLLSSRAKKQGAGALVDEDGFTVVVRGGRYGRTGGRGKGVAAVGVASRGFKGDEKAKGKGAGELRDFYRFQQVDRKKKELADLRAKFEQDKAKVAEMQRSKRFKPY